MSSQTSRRSLVAGAAALSALAIPVAAVAGDHRCSPEADPIFGAIKACVEAERADAEASFRHEAAQDRFEEEYGSEEPDAIPKVLREMWSRHEGLEQLSKVQCNSHDAVDAFMDRVLRSQPDEKAATQIRARLHAELDRQTAAYNETVMPLKEAMDLSSRRFAATSQTLLETAPIGLAGLAAFFACLRDNAPLRQYLMSYDDNVEAMFGTIATATANFAARAH